MQYLKIIGLSLVAAVVYGIIHDQVTARICVEYFTIGHPPIFGNLQDPTLLALGWGIVATWWVGLILGVPLAACARIGSWPKLSAGQLFKPVLVLLVAMGCLATVAGFVGYALAQRGVIYLVDWLAQLIPPEKHALFLADGAAHLVSYAAGGLGGLFLWVWILIKRYRLQRAEQAGVAPAAPSDPPADAAGR